MKSRITVEIDYENNRTPILRIVQENSSDVRDGLIKDFLQSLGHTSRWLRIEFQRWNEETKQQVYNITPITTSEIPNEIALMEALIGEKHLPEVPSSNSSIIVEEIGGFNIRGNALKY